MLVVAEDNRVCRDILRFNLTRAGYAVWVSGDGGEVLKHLATAEPSLILTDFQMPGATGEEICRFARRERQLTCPIILCTAKGIELDGTNFRETYGVTEIVYKPFSMQSILETVAKHLRGAAAIV